MGCAVAVAIAVSGCDPETPEMPDAGTPTPDAGMTFPDAMAAAPDATVMMPDATVMMPDAGSEPHDCVPYMPTPAGDDISGQWSGPDDENTTTITVPADPGGGIVTVTLSSNRPPPFLTATLVIPNAAGAVFAGGAAGTSNERMVTTRFEAAPGESYTLTAAQFGGLRPDEYPVDYTMTWTFASKVDCYEPNNDHPDAKRVPLNTELSAYYLGSMRDERQAMDGYGDWYSFTLTEQSNVSVTFTSTSPGDVSRLRLDIFDPSRNGFPPPGFQVTLGPDAAAVLDMGMLMTPPTVELDPGTYLVQVSSGSGPVHTMGPDEDTPKHFIHEYKFQVNATPL